MKRVIQHLGVYKKDTLLCVGLTALEVIMDVLLPFITARIIDEGLEASNLSAVYRYGAILLVMAFLFFFFGATAGKFAASASSGLAANLLYADTLGVVLLHIRAGSLYLLAALGHTFLKGLSVPLDKQRNQQ